jgi:hypothetical protein
LTKYLSHEWQLFMMKLCSYSDRWQYLSLEIPTHMGWIQGAFAPLAKRCLPALTELHIIHNSTWTEAPFNRAILQYFINIPALRHLQLDRIDCEPLDVPNVTLPVPWHQLSTFTSGITNPNGADDLNVLKLLPYLQELKIRSYARVDFLNWAEGVERNMKPIYLNKVRRLEALSHVLPALTLPRLEEVVIYAIPLGEGKLGIDPVNAKILRNLIARSSCPLQYLTLGGFSPEILAFLQSTRAPIISLDITSDDLRGSFALIDTLTINHNSSSTMLHGLQFFALKTVLPEFDTSKFLNLMLLMVQSRCDESNFRLNPQANRLQILKLGFPYSRVSAEVKANFSCLLRTFLRQKGLVIEL